MSDLVNLIGSLIPTHYEIESHPTLVDLTPWYSVNCSLDVYEWLRDNYIEDVDYYVSRHIKGVWIDMPESILILMKLRW
jgi:hypothetical protein